MAPEDSNKSQYTTITNSHGQKLHIQDPHLYTQSELDWIREKHNSSDPSEPLNIKHNETVVPEDGQTAFIHVAYLLASAEMRADPAFDPPQWLLQELQRRKDEMDREKEKWQPDPETDEKKD